MSAFSAAMNALFRDKNMAVDAVWVPLVTGEPVSIRGIESSPDDLNNFGQMNIVSDSVIFQVEASQILNPAKYDRISYGGCDYVINAAPRRDADRHVWVLELVVDD